MQSVRTAGQKYLTADVSPLAATLVRYLFAVPFVILYIAWLLADREATLPPLSLHFVVACFIAGVLQILATVLLVRLFTLRNFAVGSCYIRSEVLTTAILGLLLFGEFVSGLGWVAMLICVAGLVLITIAKTGKLSELWNQSALYGLGAGVSLSFTSLMIRQASLSFGIDDAMFTAALTLGFYGADADGDLPRVGGFTVTPANCALFSSGGGPACSSVSPVSSAQLAGSRPSPWNGLPM